MRFFFVLFLCVGLTSERTSSAQQANEVQPAVSVLPLSGNTVTDIHLRPLFTTTIRLPEYGHFRGRRRAHTFRSRAFGPGASARIRETQHARGCNKQPDHRSAVGTRDQHASHLGRGRRKNAGRLRHQLSASPELPDRLVGPGDNARGGSAGPQETYRNKSRSSIWHSRVRQRLLLRNGKVLPRRTAGIRMQRPQASRCSERWERCARKAMRCGSPTRC